MNIKRNWVTVLALIIGLMGLLAAMGVISFPNGKLAGSKAQIELGSTLYADNCASCHGANLEGQPNWKTPNSDGTMPAPPHDDEGHTWHHADKLLFDYIKLGGKGVLAQAGIMDFNSGMPGFGDAMSDRDIEAVLTFIKSEWTEQNRTSQRARTAADQKSNQ